MRRDLIIALLGSLLLHGGLAICSEFFKGGPPPVAKVEPIPTIELLPIPPVEPEKLEVVDAVSEAGSDVSDIVPPMQADVAIVTDSPFIQQIQPPPPPGIQRPTNAVTIPNIRPGSGRGKGMGNGIGDLFDMANLDQKVGVRINAQPVYPYEMKRAGISGEVDVAFVVDTQGNPRDVQVLRSSQRDFESAAIQCVLRSKFTPGKKNGAYVNARVTRTVSFKITEDT